MVVLGPLWRFGYEVEVFIGSGWRQLRVIPELIVVFEEQPIGVGTTERPDAGEEARQHRLGGSRRCRCSSTKRERGALQHTTDWGRGRARVDKTLNHHQCSTLKTFFSNVPRRGEPVEKLVAGLSCSPNRALEPRNRCFRSLIEGQKQATGSFQPPEVFSENPW